MLLALTLAVEDLGDFVDFNKKGVNDVYIKDFGKSKMVKMVVRKNFSMSITMETKNV